MTTHTLAICALTAAAGTASADVIDIFGDIDNSTEKTGATFSGSLDYTHQGGDLGTLIVSLTNDTPEFLDGYLTGFVFNILSDDDNASATLSATTDPDFLDTGEENGQPFGIFDAGAALGADWQGGGTPNLGIGVGDSGMFTFDVTASDAENLSASSFIGSDGVNFAVRFRGFVQGDSDKVPGIIPAPGAGLVLLGGLGLAARRRR